MASYRDINTIGWLHLSDLHFVEDDIENNIFLSSILKQCNDHQFNNMHVDFVIITGDFRNFNDTRQVFLSVEWIRKLMDKDHLNLSINSDLFIVPGNHDVDNDIVGNKKEKRTKIIKYLNVDYSNGQEHENVDYIAELNDLGIISNDVTRKTQNNLYVIQAILNNQGHFLESCFSQYKENAQCLIDYYHNNELTCKTHIRTWRDTYNQPQINIIHLNTALISDGNDHCQITDILELSKMLSDPDIDYTLPAIVIAHHNFYDLSPEIHDKLIQLMNLTNVYVWLCGDAHQYNEKSNNAFINRKLNDNNKLVLPVFVCGKSAACVTDTWSDFGVIHYGLKNEIVYTTQCIYKKDGNGICLSINPDRSFIFGRYNGNTGESDSNKKHILDITNIDSYGEISERTIGIDTLNYVRNAMGKNALGKSNEELLKSFFVLSDTIISENLRYDLPRFAFDLPREEYDAKLYINNEIASLFNGKVTLYYWNDYTKYRFICNYIDLSLIYYKDHFKGVLFGYSVLDSKAKDRIKNLYKVQRLALCNRITVVLDKHSTSLSVSKDVHRIKWKLHECNSLLEVWIKEINKIIQIEQSYGITFDLFPIYGYENIVQLYVAIDNVYAGIIHHRNGTFYFPDVNDYQTSNSSPCILEDDVDIPLEPVTIYDVKFIPRTSVLLPGKRRKNRAKKVIEAEISIVYAALINGERIFPVL